MDAIKTYLDNVFAAFPQTDEVLSLKREMLASMEEKYHALKRENKSENDAVGSIISNFGNIDEIAAELGITPEKRGRKETISLTDDEAMEFLKNWRRGGAAIGFGVWMILIGVGAMIFFTQFVLVLGLFIKVVTIAVAVAIIVHASIKLHAYEKYQRRKIILSATMRDILESTHKAYLSRFGALIATGVAVIIVTVAFFVLLVIVGFVFFPISLLLGAIGFAVFLIITAAFGKSAFDILLK